MVGKLLIYLGSVLCYISIVLMPIFIYIRKKETKNVFEYLKLKDNWKKGMLAGGIISILYIAVLLIKVRLSSNINLNLNLGVRWLYGLSVGLLEEIPIRGFLLNKFQNKFSFFYSNIFVTLIFIILHFPTWMISGTNIIESGIKIAFVSMAFGYLVKEYDSLWPSIICHSVFNLSMWIGLT